MKDKYIQFLIYSGISVSLTACSLMLTTYICFSREIRPGILLTVFTGTFFIYNTDHIRGVDSDRRSDPSRVLFVVKNKKLLLYSAIISFVVSVTTAVICLSLSELSVLVPVLTLGLLHRRLKQNTVLKSAYIAASWLGVVVLLPVVEDIPDNISWFTLITGPVLFANAYAYTIQPTEDQPADSVNIPVMISAAACLAALVAPPDFMPLLPVPLATLFSLLIFRKERYFKYLFLDGSLFAGSVLSIIVFQL